MSDSRLANFDKILHILVLQTTQIVKIQNIQKSKMAERRYCEKPSCDISSTNRLILMKFGTVVHIGKPYALSTKNLNF